jgi:UDP-N-acetylmuramoyl-tripeptide--D-alanyl-D-alanine ligase
MTVVLTAQEAASATGGHWRGPAPGAPAFEGVYSDSRSPRPGALFVALRGPNFDGHHFLEQAAGQKAAALLAETKVLEERPELLERLGVPVLVVKDTLQALGDLAAAWRNKIGPRVIAITGSVGKTTVKDMTAAVLSGQFRTHASRKNFNNLIGQPMAILEMPADTEMLVLECGADRPGEMQRHAEVCAPDLAVVTHVVPCHLERFGSLEEVAREKGKLLAGLTEAGVTALVFSGSAEQQALLAECRKPVQFYGPGNQSGFFAEDIALDDEGRAQFTFIHPGGRFPIRLRTLGIHQVDNATAAAAIGTLVGTKEETIREGLESYEGAWGRMKKTKLPDDVLLIEDVYNSNPASMQAALDFLSQVHRRPRIGIFGEMWDLGQEAEHWHWVVGRQITRDHLEILVGVGSLAGLFIEGSVKGGMPPERLEHFLSNEDTLQWIKGNLEPGCVVFIKGSRGMQMEHISGGLKNAES